MKTAIINITTTDGKIFREEIEMTKMPNYSAFENIQTSLDEFFTDWKNFDKPMNIKNITLESEMTGKIFYKGEF